MVMLADELRSVALDLASLYGEELSVDDAVFIDDVMHDKPSRVEFIDDQGYAWAREHTYGRYVSTRDHSFWRVGKFTRGLLYGWKVEPAWKKPTR